MTDNFIEFRLMLQALVRWPCGLFVNALRRDHSKRPVHILFCMVDHFEPGSGGASVETECARVDRLLLEYPRLASRHRDFSGTPIQRTWFFPPHYHRLYHLKKLVSLCQKGFGEIELHLHHGKTRPDTRLNLMETIQACLKAYARFGIFARTDGRLRYGFVHGDWALDNSRNNRYCGVSQEIDVLIKTGCYADFTFPAVNESNPDQINSIFYAMDGPGPKSYNRGDRVRFNRKKRPGGLMIVQGPFHPYFQPNPPYLRYFGDAINGAPPVSNRRVDTWISTGIHVEGKPDWVVVKVHTHGATDADAVLGPEMDRILTHLERHYNDGLRYRLHYVTARQLYNVIKAAEAGVQGDDPRRCREYEICAPEYDASPDICSAPPFLLSLIERTYPLERHKFHKSIEKTIH